jgi:hypothetical protein
VTDVIAQDNIALIAGARDNRPPAGDRAARVD